MPIKELPYDSLAEESLLGNILLYEKAIVKTVEAGLAPDDFYLENHKNIFRILVAMYQNHEKIDVVSASARLKDYGYFEKIGGYEYLMHLTTSTISFAHTQEYIRIIRDKSLTRKILLAAQNIEQDSLGGTCDIGDLLDKAERTILNVTRSRNVNDFIDGATLFEKTIEKIESIEARGTTITGLKSFYGDLDYLTTGFQRGDLIILAARPSVGKTALALNFALNCATIAPGAIAIFSLEMPAEQLSMRMLSAKAKVSGYKLRTGQLSDSDWSSINGAYQELKQQKFYIDDTPGIKIADMFAKCRKLKNEKDLSLIIVDYIQLIRSSYSSESRQQEVSDISRSLKALAREMDVPVIALSQLSRSVEKRDDKRPMLSDLRESGSLEQDADIVMFIYRESYYKRNNEEEKEIPDREDVELTLAKHRNGPTGTVNLAFERDISCFYGVQHSE